MRIEKFLLGLVLCLALALFMAVVNSHYPVHQWLIWRYLFISWLAVVWGVSCLSCGSFVLDRLRITPESGESDAVLAFPAGVFAFQTAVFLLGLLGLLNGLTFILLPTVFALSGARRLNAAWTSVTKIELPRTPVHLGVVLFGIAGCGLIYFQILSPEVFHWDARWYHLPLAQQYALQGAVRRFPEGWWLDGYPHAASFVYTWAFLFPGSILFDKLELCVHLEFVVFLATIASIPTLVRRFAPSLPARGSWAAIFLFPGIFLYDSNLCAGADHFAALWCIPIVLTLIRLWGSWRVNDAILFAAFIAAGMASKYSAWSMLLLPVLLAVVRGVWLAGQRLRGRGDLGRSVLAPAFFATVTLLLLSAQHWLKNWIWYGDPLYPVLHRYLHVHPWSSESAASFRLFQKFSPPVRAGVAGLWDALVATVTFSFKPNDWLPLHRDVPVFGSLFTLSTLCLLFVRASVRLWLAYAGVMLSIFVWYLVNHRDRYLQAWLPCMVACTVATLGLVWTRRDAGMGVRGLVVALIGVQVVWGADVPFLPTHSLVGDSPIHLVSRFIASGFLGTPARLRPYGDEGLVAERLPRGANLLLHEINLQVGFGARTVNDQWQGRLSYASLGTPVAIHRELHDLGVTHLVWSTTSTGWNSVGGDLAFMGYALNHALDQTVVGKFTLARFPDHSPPAAFNDRVAIFGCGAPYASGLFHLRRLTIPEPGEAWAAPDAPIADAPSAVHDAGFLVVDPVCAPPLPPEVKDLFHPPVSRESLRLYVRRR